MSNLASSMSASIKSSHNCPMIKDSDPQTAKNIVFPFDCFFLLLFSGNFQCPESSFEELRIGELKCPDCVNKKVCSLPSSFGQFLNQTGCSMQSNPVLPFLSFDLTMDCSSRASLKWSTEVHPFYVG